MIRPILLLIMISLPAAANAGDLEVTVTGVRNANGHVLVAVCSQTDFLSRTCTYRGRAPAHGGAVVVRVTGVPAGTYAVEAYHDENDNNVLDRTVLGVPKEGLGLSRDAPIRFGPPSFGDAAVSVPEAGGAIRFALRYFD